MPAITNVIPYTSVQTGGVPIDITGTGFNTSDLSKSFSAAPFYTQNVIGGGLVSTPNISGIRLTVPATPGASAGVILDPILEKVFDATITVDQLTDTFPATDGAIIYSMRAQDVSNTQTYFDVSIGYKDDFGYFVETSGKILNNSIGNIRKAIGPYDIEALRIFRSESRFTAYTKVNGDWVEASQLNGYSDFLSNIVSSISNSPIPPTSGFSVRLRDFKLVHAVSFADTPTTLNSVSSTAIQVTTHPGDFNSGNLVVAFPDSTIAQWSGVVSYTEEEEVQRLSFNADMTISVFQEYVNPTRSELFMEAGGFTWDQDEFLAEGRNNNNLYIPSLWDARTFNVPVDFFQSGHGFADNIEQIDIIKLKRNSVEQWHARLNHGTYFIRNADYYLFSDESVTTRLESAVTSDGRSLKYLRYLPKPGIPIAVSTLELDVRSGNVVERKRFSKRTKFTGKVSNGIELDTDYPANIDPKFFEFIVHYNSNNMYENWKVPVINATAGVYTFTLPDLPLFDFPIVFSRRDIFGTQRYVAKKYGDPEAAYGKFKYGTGLEQVGDWTVDYNTGEVQVWLDQDYVDLGYVTFTFDYPAAVEFNNNYLVDVGFGITNPVPADLSSLDRLGDSSGRADQTFTVDEFPIFDMSEGEYFDNTSFKLFIYNPSTLTFDNSWTRVKTFANTTGTDKVYRLEADSGAVTFGNGVNGAIPPKYTRILAAYRVSARIEYEPVSSVNYWTGKATDLNLSRNNLSSGFVHITRREQTPDNIALEFADAEISALEFSALTATVYDLEGEPMSGVEVEFEIMAAGGMAEDESVITDSDGQASTVFIPNSTIESMGIVIQAYEAGPDSATPGIMDSNAYQSNGAIPNAKLLAPEAVVSLADEVYLFKILDKGDAFTPYDNATRKGGVYQVYYKYDTASGTNKLIRPSAVNGRILIFDEPLPQSYDPAGINYDPDIRGFCIISKKRVSAIAKTTYRGIAIQSQTAFLRVGYSPIQKGEWTLPILPVMFDGSEIDRATYITINP